MDVGPAIGAVSSMMALKALDEFGLADRVRLFLVDVSEDVLVMNKAGNFNYPEDLTNKLFGSQAVFERYRSIIEGATLLKNAADDGICLPHDSVDIALTCFLFHHIHNNRKARAGSEVIRVARGGIFVADEFFGNYYADFAVHHQHDAVPLAPEQPISYVESMTQVLPNTAFGEGKSTQPRHYTYWVMKFPLRDFERVGVLSLH